jgi:hypothetical protein
MFRVEMGRIGLSHELKHAKRVHPVVICLIWGQASHANVEVFDLFN